MAVAKKYQTKFHVCFLIEANKTNNTPKDNLYLAASVLAPYSSSGFSYPERPCFVERLWDLWPCRVGWLAPVLAGRAGSALGDSVQVGFDWGFACLVHQDLLWIELKINSSHLIKSNNFLTKPGAIPPSFYSSISVKFVLKFSY